MLASILLSWSFNRVGNVHFVSCHVEHTGNMETAFKNFILFRSERWYTIKPASIQCIVIRDLDIYTSNGVSSPRNPHHRDYKAVVPAKTVAVDQAAVTSRNRCRG
jgi:hypothetical protein